MVLILVDKGSKLNLWKINTTTERQDTFQMQKGKVHKLFWNIVNVLHNLRNFLSYKDTFLTYIWVDEWRQHYYQVLKLYICDSVQRGAVKIWQPEVTPISSLKPKQPNLSAPIGDAPPVQKTSLHAKKQDYVPIGVAHNRAPQVIIYSHVYQFFYLFMII